MSQSSPWQQKRGEINRLRQGGYGYEILSHMRQTFVGMGTMDVRCDSPEARGEASDFPDFALETTTHHGNR
jgi:hypothetical protein